jgi:hypothetical protein
MSLSLLLNTSSSSSSEPEITRRKRPAYRDQETPHARKFVAVSSSASVASKISIPDANTDPNGYQGALVDNSKGHGIASDLLIRKHCPDLTNSQSEDVRSRAIVPVQRHDQHLDEDIVRIPDAHRAVSRTEIHTYPDIHEHTADESGPSAYTDLASEDHMRLRPSISRLVQFHSLDATLSSHSINWDSLTLFSHPVDRNPRPLSCTFPAHASISNILLAGANGQRGAVAHSVSGTGSLSQPYNGPTYDARGVTSALGRLNVRESSYRSDQIGYAGSFSDAGISTPISFSDKGGLPLAKVHVGVGSENVCTVCGKAFRTRQGHMRHNQTVQ